MLRRALRLLVCFAAVATVTFVAYRVLRVNAPTVGFAYLVLVLVIAGGWGLFEASVTSIAAALSFNSYFFEPIGGVPDILLTNTGFGRRTDQGPSIPELAWQRPKSPPVDGQHRVASQDTAVDPTCR